MEAENDADLEWDKLQETQAIQDAQLGWLRLLGNAVVRALRLAAASKTDDGYSNREEL